MQTLPVWNIMNNFRRKSSADLHEDDDWSIDNEEELVHIGLHRFKVSVCLSWFQSVSHQRKMKDISNNTSSSADRSDCGVATAEDAVDNATTTPASWRRSGSRGVVVGRRGPRVTGAKRSAMVLGNPNTRSWPKKKGLGPKTKEQQTVEILQRTKDEESTQQWGYYQENCSRDRSQLSEMEGREGRLHYSGGRNPSAEKQPPCSNQWGRNISGTFPMPTMYESTLIWDIGKNGRMNVWKAGYKDEQKHI